MISLKSLQQLFKRPLVLQNHFYFGKQGLLIEEYNKKVQIGEIKKDYRQRDIVKDLDEIQYQVGLSYKAWDRWATDLDVQRESLKKKGEALSKEKVKPKRAAKKAPGGSIFSLWKTTEKIHDNTYEVFDEQNKDAQLTWKSLEKHVQSADPEQLPRMKSLYISGDVGCGKTFIMDMFYKNLQIDKKWRVHFNEFMLVVNQNLHRYQKDTTIKDPINRVATKYAAMFRVICFDEFQVTDVADALILKELFTQLFRYNVIIVMTSNKQVDDIYKGGLQYRIFEPFIPYIKSTCKVIHLDSERDYRFDMMQEELEQEIIQYTYLYPNNKANNYRLEKQFKKIAKTADLGQDQSVQVIEGRSITISNARNGVAIFDYEDIIEGNFGPSDYIAISQNFHTIMVKNITKQTMQNRTAARRLIILVDEMYNHNVKFYFTSTGDLDHIFSKDQMAHNATTQEDSTQDHDFHGHDLYDEAFSLHRTKSRINEMQTQIYLDKVAYYSEQKEEAGKK